jgi:hypothetical protein
VLVAIALILLYTTTTTARLRREARINRLRENAEIAYYAAESGFNRARARIITGGANPDPALDKVLALHRTVETLPGGGSYSLAVTSPTAGVYEIESTGTFGQGDYEATRTVSGTVTITNPTDDGRFYRVATQYNR